MKVVLRQKEKRIQNSISLSEHLPTARAQSSGFSIDTIFFNVIMHKNEQMIAYAVHSFHLDTELSFVANSCRHSYSGACGWRTVWTQELETCLGSIMRSPSHETC